MSRAEARAAARIRDLGEVFLRPWVEGGEARVGRPAGPGLLSAWRHLEAVDPETLAATRRALSDGVRQLAPGARVPWPERGAAGCAIAAHDLVWATDPSSRVWPASNARARVVAWAQAIATGLGPPVTRGAALGRHAVVDRLFVAVRADVEVQTWAARHRYEGRPVPSRVVAWPRLRGVRRARSLRSVADLLDEPLRGAGGTPGTAEALRALVHASPVTALLRSDRVGTPRLDGGTLAVLADDRLRGGVARALAAGEPGALAAFSDALEGFAAPPEERWPALALAYELHAGAALGPSPEAPFSARAPGTGVLDALLPILATPGALPAHYQALAPGDAVRLERRVTFLARRTPNKLRDRAQRAVQGDGWAPPAPLEIAT